MAVPETTSTVTIETPSAPAVETLTAATTGTPTVGTTLTAETNAADGATFQWLRNGKAISKATGTTYKPVAADVGKNLSLKVTGSKAGHETISKASKALSKTAAGTLKSTTPKIS